ncbi:MAG: 2TM domain-containing protein, partial [Campylobacteraceae bacterium]|nr:2TM domain-containing protein [Campylobacteraceae bacterium]
MKKIIGTKKLMIMERLPDFETDKKAIRARKRIEDIKGFYQHLLAYCLFTPFTIFINYKTYWDYKWFWFSIIGWGIGLAIHAFIVFVQKGVFGSKWEERKIEELLRKEEN